MRGTHRVTEPAYLTDAFGREAVAFIDHHKAEPFFLYLAFNAVHAPLQATADYRKRFPQVKDEKRQTFSAMLSAMDDAVGHVLDKLSPVAARRKDADLFHQRQRRPDSADHLAQRSPPRHEDHHLGRGHPHSRTSSSGQATCRRAKSTIDP